MTADPMAAQRMSSDLDPVKLVEEIQYLRGSGNIKRFRYTPEEQAQIRLQQEQMAAAQTPAPAGPTISGHTNAPQIHVDRSTTVHIKPQDKKKPSSNGAK